MGRVLEGKRALIVGGAGGGIGRAISRAFAAAGAEVAASGSRAITLFVPAAPLHEIADEDWDLMFELNLRYVARAVRAVLHVFLEQAAGGTIVSVGSITSIAANPLQAAYGAAKAGLASLARSVAAEYSRHGIRMNVVTCGPIATPVAAAANVSTELSWIPLGRAGSTAEVANAVVWLASPLSEYVTGQSLVLDGGATAIGPFPPAAEDVQNR
jgi:3-oxoacyl-[acyl-carrier protein] reductase